MKSCKLTILAFFALILLYSSAFADYKIILKNGREFIVDDYKEVDGKIKFYKGGGEIEIDKGNVEDIKKVTVTKKTEENTPAETVKKESTETEVTPAGKGGDTKSKRQESENKLKEIAKKKEELKAEKDKLDEEKKKLEEDIKKAGRVTYYREKRELEHRISALEEKIKKFNDELSRVEQEQESVLKEAAAQSK